MIRHGFGLLSPVLVCAGMVAVARAGDVFVGTVTGVIDGDTITVVDQLKTEHKIILQGIDAPEKRQPFGEEAKQFVSDACSGKTVTVKVTSGDKAKGEIAEVILPDAHNLSQKVIAAGFAWLVPEQAAENRTLIAFEKQAKAAKAGLWADATPTPPWEWRTKKGNDRAPGAATTMTFYNPVTEKRESTSDPDEIAKYLADGWLLDSTTKAEGGRVPGYVTVYTYFNPATSKRETTTDPKIASQYLSKGWILESTKRIKAPADNKPATP